MESAQEREVIPSRYAIFSVFGRLLPFTVFFALVLVHVQLFRVEITEIITHDHGFGTISFVVDRALGIIFASFVALIYIFRKPPAGVRHDPVAVFVSMYASFIPLGIRPIAALMEAGGFSNYNDVQLTVANVMIAGGVALSLYGLFYLKLNFSIMPEARGVTRTGPYSVVRHPVYTGEIVSLAGVVVTLPNALSFFIFATFVAGQWLRTRWEERVLAEAFPDYLEYSRQVTKRLIPWVI